MSPAEASPDAWRPAAVRFYAGGRAEETPREVWWQGAWRPVRLLGGDIMAPADGDGAAWRRFRLEMPGGQRILLRGRAERWQAKSLTAFAAGC